VRYQKIESTIWYDEKFKSLTPSQQRLWLYLLTCPHGNLIGLFVLPLGYIKTDLEVLPKDLRKDLGKVIEKGFVRYCESTNLIWIKNYLKYNPLTNPNQKKAAIRIITELPKSPVIADFLRTSETLCEGLTEGLPKDFRNQTTEQTTETTTEQTTKNTLCEEPDDSSPEVIVPGKEITKIWNEVWKNTAIPNVMELNSTRRGWIRREYLKQREGLQTTEDFRKFFIYLRDNCPFLQKEGKRGTVWFSFDWLFSKPVNFTKALEGHYEARK
jgi:hypothetical protein